MNLFKLRPVHRLALAAVALAFAAPSTAAASAADCDSQVLSKPFAPWADFADYTPLDDGGFESGGAGWTLAGGAAVTDGNESFYVNDAGDSQSLRLPPRSSAVSPPICIGVAHPTMRFFAKQSGGGLLSLPALRVDVRFRLGGATQSLPIGVLVAGSKWQPTLPLPVVINFLSAVPGLDSVSFAFTPVGNATWQIDDVYVDPSARR